MDASSAPGKISRRRNLRSDFGLLIPVILAIVLCLISFLSLRYVIQTKDNAVLNHAPDLIQIQRLVIASQSMDQSGRAFLFTRRVWQRPVLFQRMLEEQSRFREELGATRPVLPTAEGKELLDLAAHLAERYFLFLNDAIAMQRSGASLGHISAFFDRQVAHRYDRMIGTLSALSAFKEAQLDEATRASIGASTKAKRLILLSGLIAILLGATLGVFFIGVLGKSRSEEESLRESLQIRDEFISVASHELQNPVTAILMQTELLRRLIDSSEAHSGRGRELQMVGRCLTEIKRLSGLVNELMDLTRLRLGRLALERTEVDLGSLVREVVEANTAEAQMRGCTIRIDCEDRIVGSWDPTRVSQVAYNLISNAIKYGGGKPISVRVENDRRRNVARLLVQDQGVGISREIQGKIFRRFERGEADRKIRGLGLGLYIVRQIVEGHGGRIWVRSSPGKGSLFIVELPFGELKSEPRESGRRAA